MTSPGPELGDRAEIRAIVTQADTAIAAGSGDVPVLATPRLLALAEAAAVAAIAPRLKASQTSVGTAARLEHRRASPVGAELEIEAELTEMDGNRLVFMFIARPADGSDQVLGAGTIERVVLDRERFVTQAQTTGAQTPVVDLG